ncbi:MAG: hypothetical protein ACRDSK_06480 [Actinophytocola sp.]|uniref:hypothetical protein n=1 Tax=Actinophytocola sp. TaxID=1872138 RepID=UPI003D6A6887
MTLAAVPSAVNLARLLVRFNLYRWAFDAGFIRRVVAVAEKLVVHAVATTGVVEDEPLYAAAFDDLDVIVVRLRIFAGRVVVEVWDRTEAPPHEALATALAVTDAERWDFAVPLPGCRVVWCLVAPQPVAGVVEGWLPQRVPAPTRPGAGVRAAGPVNKELLERVLEGLRHVL